MTDHKRWRHYRTEYGDWTLIEEGTDPVRYLLPHPSVFDPTWQVYPYDLSLPEVMVQSDGEENVHLEGIKSTRITPAPYESERWWIYRGEWRQNPARRMSWDREGIHALKGLAMGSTLLINLTGVPLWAILAAVTLMTYVFLRYEETEEAEIDDRAYRDINGWMMGFGPSAIGSLIAIGFLT